METFLTVALSFSGGMTFAFWIFKHYEPVEVWILDETDTTAVQTYPRAAEEAA
jgi:hypothetical protein